jgi:type II secretory pathway pseudopilin PulG
MRGRPQRENGAFCLLELVLVVAIIAIVAAIGIPRMSRSTRGASDSALIGNLRVLRGAIDRYATEHGGRYPADTDIADQLMQYTDLFGDVRPTVDATHVYGPYLSRIPPLPVGARKGTTGIAANAGVTVAWVYDKATGAVRANCGPSEVDETGKPYRDY